MPLTSYLFLILAVALGTASNGFAKSAEGFTLLIPSIITAITIVLCMYVLSHVMKAIPVGVTYASFAGLTIIATTVVGVFKFNQEAKANMKQMNNFSTILYSKFKTEILKI